MQNETEACRRRAQEARESAAGAEGDLRSEYLKIAEMWDLLAREYEAVARLGKG
jgi:hypothetical protein